MVDSFEYKINKYKYKLRREMDQNKVKLYKEKIRYYKSQLKQTGGGAGDEQQTAIKTQLGNIGGLRGQLIEGMNDFLITVVNNVNAKNLDTVISNKILNQKFNI